MARLLAVCALVVGLGFLASPATPLPHGLIGNATPCSSGSIAAVIGGKHLCLKTGQACKAKLERQYRRYRFHCQNGRLTRVPKPSSVYSAKVDVGGYRLAIRCRGRGSPTIILESGFDSPGTTWSLVQPKVASITRVCSYDRAGVGDSDPRKPAGPAPAARVVEELHTLLTRAKIAPPYVMGGWSFGGFFARFYTKRYPGEVLGLVSVDGTPAGLPPGRPDIDLVTGDHESFYMAAADAEVAAAPDLGVRPLIVLTRGKAEATPDLEALWLKLQKQVTRLSTAPILVRADTSGHAILTDNPKLTAEALRQVIAAVRNHASLPSCTETPLPRLNGTCLDPNTQ